MMSMCLLSIKTIFNVYKADTGRLRFVKRYAARFGDRVSQDCLYRFNEPVSPHLALKLQIGQDKEKVA